MMLRRVLCGELADALRTIDLLGAIVDEIMRLHIEMHVMVTIVKRG